MKRFTVFLALALISFFSIFLTSCDKDQQTAIELWGTWKGTINVKAFNSRHTKYTYTVWHFEGKPGSRQGNGWERDFGQDGSSYKSDFRWAVSDGVIQLIYNNDSWSTVYIYDWSISGEDDNSKYFDGQIDDGSGNRIRFQLDYDYDNRY
nr:hypothetical protein [uncultured Prevotella sp.]